MLSLSTAHSHIPNSHRHRLPRLVGLSRLILDNNSKKRAKVLKTGTNLSRYLGITELRGTLEFGKDFNNSWRCLCQETEGDAELDSEIMNFMEKSDKPTMFPTKSELVQAGRMDLVQAIKKRGGWYSFGWDDENVEDIVDEELDFDIGELQRRVENIRESASLREQCDYSSSGCETSQLNLTSGSLDSMELAASASLDRPLENGSIEDAGIDGILNRLEKQRNRDFGIEKERHQYNGDVNSKDEEENSLPGTPFGSARTNVGDNGRLSPGFQQEDILNSSGGKSCPNAEPVSWRTWSNHRAGVQYADFEAAEISLSKNKMDTENEIRHDGISIPTGEYAENQYKHIRTRLQHLKSELTSSLHSLRSKMVDEMPEEVAGCSSDFQKLSDAVEFQENEFMSAKDKLRSIRAKLSVLEGKISLAITDAQKIVLVKQKRIDSAHKALHLLRSTSVVWPNSASEVLLAGSFDGWTSQRKMEKSRTGIFSICLKLYPGKYEIKFIVDGIWKIDPLRPIVNNNGHENNLLIIT